MDEIVGFCISKGEPATPPWLDDYPWLNRERVRLGDWTALVWGHGTLPVTRNGFVAGKRGNRCAEVTVDERLTVSRDYLGQLPVYYGGDTVSTCEECVLLDIGQATLNVDYLPLFLQIGASVGPHTLWNEVGQLFGNCEPVPGVVSRWMDPPQPEEAEWEEAIRGAVNRSVQGKTHLAVTSGYDSRLLALYMDPQDTIGWTLPLSPSMRDGEYVWAKRTAEILGMEHRAVIIQDFPAWLEKSVEYMGANTSQIMAMWFAMIGEINREERRPVVHGGPGDSLSGNPVRRTLEVVEPMDGADQQGLALIRDRGAGWEDDELDRLLTYDWQDRGLGRHFLDTPGPDFAAKADLFRVRTRSAALATGRMNVGELWGGAICPYADTEYAVWALNLGVEKRIDRNSQVEWATHAYPAIFNRPSPLQDDDYTAENSIDEELACDPWPLMGTQFNELFNQAYIDALVERALDRDMWAIRRAWPLQAIAWAFMRGYVK